MSEESMNSPKKADHKLPAIAHIMCGWPLLLIAIGGAIGGGLGAMAYGLNLKIYKSQLPTPAKLVLNPLIGIAAVGIWIAVVTAIQQSRG